MDKNLKILLLAVVFLAVIFLWANISEKSQLGSDNRGSVTKDVYSHYGTPTVRIAVVTGMHPREGLATNMVPHAIKLFALLNQVEVADYHVRVDDKPDDFTIGRNNGEGLVAQYAVPDIVKSNYQLVIVSHDHEPGYGEGYYIATPTHDVKSVSIGNAVHQILTYFNFYPGSSDVKSQASSITLVDYPITLAGIPVLVYEMPEWSNFFEAMYHTYKLMQASSMALSS
ncbi:MAG TPA: hypothetical protein PKI66_06270 [Methanobacteriaceae archaeon]|nr:hypothetical protein [Euryarchaeota archaeon]HNR26298.1 hypothetical protein [Methanobacteriaceae archaeon]